jgi:hypothetical protein
VVAIVPAISSRSYIVVVAAILALGLGALRLYVTTFSMAFLEEGYPIWLSKQNFIRNCDLGEVAIFGDSRVEAGLIAEGQPLKMTILGFGGTTPIETYFAVKHALACGRLPNRIVLAHGGAQFSRKPVFLWENAVRYDYISFAEAREINKVAVALGDTSIDQTITRDGLTGFARDFLYASNFPPIYFNSLFQGQFFRRLEKNKLTLAQTTKRRGHIPYPPHHNGDNMMGEETGLSKFEPMPTSDYFFEQTIKLLNAHNIATDWVSMPITETSSAALKPAVWDGFRAYLERYAARYPNFHVVSVLPVWPDRFFSNKDHLDEAGAKLFSAKFAECMRQRIAAGRNPAIASSCDWSWAANQKNASAAPH